MYMLYADHVATLSEKTKLFEIYMEPMLQKLEAFAPTGPLPPDVPEFHQYLEVCRWPFRKLEYSFALDALLDHLKPGDRFLDAGCGVTPFAHVLAGQGFQAEACDGDRRLIEALDRLRPERIYGSTVAYAAQDLTSITYPDAAFEAISCISVLEHIPAPLDQKAIRELLRVLKPGGLLILTVDFTPTAARGWGYFARRAGDLARDGNFREIGRGLMRKLEARQSVIQGEVRQPRSANQCFQVEHLEQDILPVLQGEAVASRLSFSTDLRSFTPDHARRLWDLEAGLYEKHGKRAVLPVAYLLRKSAVPVAA
jgi:SAM-dependent methyltransferase